MPSQAVVALIVFLFSTLGVVAQHSAAAVPYDIDEAYKVYNVLVPHEQSAQIGQGTIIIQQETVSKSEMLDPFLPGVEGCLTTEAANKFKDAIADFRRVTTKQWLLQHQFQLERPYKLLNSDTSRILFKSHGWEGFYELYPDSGGIVTLSAVGFNQDKTQAIVYSGSLCGVLCGRWSFHLMEKIGGKWIEQRGVTCHTVS